MKSQTKGYPAPFQANFDREKLAFLDLANRGDGLTPINYIFSTEGRFNFIDCITATIGTLETNILYSTDITNQNTIISKDIIASVSLVCPSIKVDFINSDINSTIRLVDPIQVDKIGSNNTGTVQFTSPTSFTPNAKFLNDSPGANSDYVGFEPRSGVSTIYVWPSPP